MKHAITINTEEETKALLDRSLIYMGAPIGKIGITSEFDHCGLIVRAQKLCCKISKASGDLFDLDVSKNHHKLKYTTLGWNLLNLARTDFFDLKNLYPCHHFNPACEAMLNTPQDWPLEHIAHGIDHFNNAEMRQAVAALNKFVDALRKTINSKEFKDQRAAIQRRYNKNLQGLRAYFKAVFAAPGCSALIGIRIDLGYKSQYLREACGASVSYEGVQAHRKAMAEHIKTYLGHACAGYVCKLEYGLLKEYHFHWLILVKKSHLRRDIIIAKALGEHWQNVITEGIGVYHNCNMQKNSYRDCCIGELQHDDPSVWKGLDQVATYVTKPDYHLRKAGAPGDRTLWRGKTPKPRKTTVGRKRRSHRSDLACTARI